MTQNVMNDKELLDILLGYQEWQTFECKRAAVQPSKLLETIVAFVNTDGGIIAIGLEDPSKFDGVKRLIGISENPDNVSEVLKLISKEIHPPLPSLSNIEVSIKNTKNIDDKLILIKVIKSNDVHSLRNGDTFVRRGNQNIKIGSLEIIRLKYEKGAIKFEDEASGISSLDIIDKELLIRYKSDNQSKEQDDWRFLKDNGLAVDKDGKFELSNGGVLLFAKNPTIALSSKCSIKISHYYGVKQAALSATEPKFVRKPYSIEGPLLYQIEKAVSYFKDVVSQSPPKLKGSTFNPTILIPETAFQEAVTNAVIHRNYSIQNDIQIRFYDDLIEIESPGTYPGHITINNIRSERFARNPLIVRTLNRFQSSPNLDIGEGVDRMFKAMIEQNLYDPIYSHPSVFPNSVFLFLINLHKVEHWDTVSNYLDKNYKITNVEARKITGINDTLIMSRQLKLWVDKGLISKIGIGKRNIFYKKPGQEIYSGYFQQAVKLSKALLPSP
ncbi:MAG: RNA-binding domain-containing protein [Candidatus Omnitrophota bacterium]